ncbi:hypothetical protein HBH25_11975 [Pseudomonas sp. hsmgli-8]|uniref:Uncharacterized protein n=1 Tax=Pseudomonas quercus TaxID=2722792 RepID=A0ABX0YHU9_9PSED|nr:hypothetical protein [Pseudomonas quercus]MBF7143264.1 hypothetical protein [Pseudomonas sp. LY10J]NJP01568.1 hypothetical protein [Pseudomonas quercus]
MTLPRDRKGQRPRASQVIPTLDAERLLHNAVTSIRLGLEDFQRCQQLVDSGGDPARALSAVRNLVAGVLLLFKYRLASCVKEPTDAAKLLFLPDEVLPHSDGQGGVVWLPIGKFKRNTIDVALIRKRFDAFGITLDWEQFDKLKVCRNDLEHLHPTNTLGEVAELVAGLFPVLRDFINANMSESPVELLGEAWQIMLAHHDFVKGIKVECTAAWQGMGVPEGMVIWLNDCRCEECGSTLLAPATESVSTHLKVDRDEEQFEYVCHACNDRGLIAPLLIETLNDAHFGDYSSGEEPEVESCDQCDHSTFVVSEQACLWCGSSLAHTACFICNEGLGQEDVGNGGLCSYHAHHVAKVMRE